MYDKTRHLAELKKLFPNLFNSTATLDRLYRLERRAHKLAEDCCNEPMNEAAVETLFNSIEEDVLAILRESTVKVFINRDPRGYALKCYPPRESGIDRDWGGYGIICPEFESR